MKIAAKLTKTTQRVTATLSESSQTLQGGLGNYVVVNNGRNGATFYPTVSPDGVISWTNDRELENPEPVNIKGEKGDRGEQGIQGVQGERGERGLQGEKGERGANGTNGVDGVSVTHRWSGTTLYVTSASGTTSANLKGAAGANGSDGVSATHRWSGTTLYVTTASGTSSANLKGDKGDRGEQGIQGIQGERGLQGEKGADGKDGVNGTNGQDGQDGYTPVKGTDYFTPADKAEMVQAVISALPVYDGSVSSV